MMSITDLEEAIQEIAGRPYNPIEVARVNDHVVNIALFDGEYHWHHHERDELFIVYQGEIEIQYKDSPNVRLRQGQVHVVPRNKEHCPRSIMPSYVLMVEPYKVDLGKSQQGLF